VPKFDGLALPVIEIMKSKSFEALLTEIPNLIEKERENMQAIVSAAEKLANSHESIKASEPTEVEVAEAVLDQIEELRTGVSKAINEMSKEVNAVIQEFEEENEERIISLFTTLDSYANSLSNRPTQ